MKILAASMILGMLSTLTACSSSMMDKDKPMMSMHKMALNDAEIMSVLNTANTGEVSHAQIALQKAQSAQVKNFAQKMVNDHSNNNQQGQALADRLGVVPRNNQVSMMLKKDSDEIMMKLNQASIQDFDKTYIDCQVKAHNMVLNTIDKKLLPNAQHAELKSFLTQTRSAVAMHLQMAEQLKASM